ncbi:MAG TPA: serine hydrolase domain-containing protein [Candidatus Bathyarchaeia archaeon]|nr:serine hydrolase domain-containing protein [Candidatus Bathyarchaeia archaeon]
MDKKNITIFGKNKIDIQKRISNVENGLPGVIMDGGPPRPNNEQKGTISEQMKALNVPGCSIAVINNFALEWMKCYGVKDNRTKKEITFETLFEAGSASKTFTAIAALQAVDKNLIDLDEPVNDKLVSWKIPENEFTKNSKVTLRQLLTHQAGINRPDSMFNIEAEGKPTIDDVLNGKAPAKNDPAVVEYTPGTNHQYSNLGYIIIEKLLTDIYGKSLSKVVREKIFSPLKMKNSLFEYPSDEEKKKMARPHDETGTAYEIGSDYAAVGHAGLITNPQEFSQFVIELMLAYNGKSEKVFSQALIKKMLTTQLAIDPNKFFGWTGQGLGIFLIELDKDLFFTHPGTNSPGSVCMMIGSPTTGQGAVFMSNGIGAELLHIELLFSIVQEYNWPIYR